MGPGEPRSDPSRFGAPPVQVRKRGGSRGSKRAEGDAEKSVAKVLRCPNSGHLELKILNRPLVTERVATKIAKATSGHHTKSSLATQDRDAKYNVTSGHLEAKILNRRLDTRNVPAKKIEATSGHQELAPNRNSRSESSEPRSEGSKRSDTDHTQQKAYEIIGFPEGTVALQNSQFNFLCVQRLL